MCEQRLFLKWRYNDRLDRDLFFLKPSLKRYPCVCTGPLAHLNPVSLTHQTKSALLCCGSAFNRNKMKRFVNWSPLSFDIGNTLAAVCGWCKEEHAVYLKLWYSGQRSKNSISFSTSRHTLSVHWNWVGNKSRTLSVHTNCSCVIVLDSSGQLGVCLHKTMRLKMAHAPLRSSSFRPLLPLIRGRCADGLVRLLALALCGFYTHPACQRRSTHGWTLQCEIWRQCMCIYVI